MFNQFTHTWPSTNDWAGEIKTDWERYLNEEKWIYRQTNGAKIKLNFIQRPGIEWMVRANADAEHFRVQQQNTHRWSCENYVTSIVVFFFILSVLWITFLMLKWFNKENGEKMDGAYHCIGTFIEWFCWFFFWLLRIMWRLDNFYWLKQIDCCSSN